jgi:hypothetical protein
MNATSSTRATARLPDLLASVNMSPGERARAQAQGEQVEALLDAVAALYRRLRAALPHAAAEPLPRRKPAH